VPETKQEIKDLEIKCKALQLKNADLETENHNLHKRKIEIQRSINDLTGLIDTKKHEQKALSKTVAGLNDEVTTRRTELMVEANRLTDAGKTLDLREKGLDTLTTQLTGLQATMDKEREDNKAQRRAIITKQAEMDGEQARIDRQNAELKSVENNLNNLTEKSVQNIEEYNNLKSQMGEDVQKLKDLVARAMDKNAEADKRLASLQDKYNEIKAGEVKNTEDRAEIAQIRKGLAQEFEKLDQKDKSLNSMIKNMAIKEQDFEVRRLRVEKIVREKGISEELKKLEEELKG
jgi:chromosome segregation ATPase